MVFCIFVFLFLSMKQNRGEVVGKTETAEYDQLVEKRQNIAKNEERDLAIEIKTRRC